MNWEIGALYKVPWSPNLHRLEKVERKYCQMHGDDLGVFKLHFRKKKNNGDPNSFGKTIHVGSSDNEGIEPATT